MIVMFVAALCFTIRGDSEESGAPAKAQRDFGALD